MTLLLGPPASGKSTLMRALTGKPAKNLKVVYLFTYLDVVSSDYV
jgi:ABC-type multidrug transport system ATPase subunit